jgi:hypothetical protein
LETDYLADLTRTLQRQWGTQVLQKASDMRPCRDKLPTGIPALDTALDGGIPQSGLTHLEGALTSGKTSVALRIIANLQAHSQPAIYLDINSAFDPDYAAHTGVNPDGLLLIRPDDLETACHIAHELLIRHDPPALVLDLGLNAITAYIHTCLRQLTSSLTRGSSALILLTPPLSGHLNARLHLAFQRSAWVFERGAITGYTSEISIRRQLNGTPTQPITFTVSLPGDAS